MASPTISERLGTFAATLDLADVPARVVGRARLQLLDSIGVALASSRFPFAREAASGLSLLESGEMVVLGLGRRFALRDALILNGMLVHGIEFDDTSIVGRIHPSASCAPAALSIGSRLRVSGRAMLCAYIAGLEGAIRIGAATNGALSKRGFDATGIVGSFGAALVAGRLLGLDARRTAAAQGIAYSAAGGNREFTAEMAWTKRFHPGWAANAGYTAAVMASREFSAPRCPYEGRFGLYRLYAVDDAGACDLEAVTRGLGEEWLLDGISFKPVPACYFNIPAIDAVRALLRAHRIDPEAIERVVVRIPEAAVNTVCEPHAVRRRPQDAYVGQFSLFHTVAATLIRGDFGLADLAPEAIADPRVAALADKVEYAVDPDSPFPAFYTAIVAVTMRNGRTFEHREYVHRGSPQRPLSDGEIVAKFLANAEPVIGLRRSRAVLGMILDLEELADVDALGDLVAEPGEEVSAARVATG